MTRDLRSVLEELGERSGRELSRRGPDPDTEIRRVTRAVVRHRTVRAGLAAACVVAVGAVGLLAGQQALGPRPAPPALEPTASVSATPSPTPSPTPTPSTTPPAASADAPPAPPAAPPELVLGAGGAVADLGVEADPATVVAYLTELFGAPPEDVNASGPSCPANGDPGAYLRWGNLSLLLRTYSYDGTDLDRPVVAGWSVQAIGATDPAWDGPWREVETRTTEGLRLGDPVSRLQELYPAVQGDEAWFGPPTYFWVVGDFPLGYGFATEGGSSTSPVRAITGGLECGE